MRVLMDKDLIMRFQRGKDTLQGLAFSFDFGLHNFLTKSWSNFPAVASVYLQPSADLHRGWILVGFPDDGKRVRIPKVEKVGRAGRICGGVRGGASHPPTNSYNQEGNPQDFDMHTLWHIMTYYDILCIHIHSRAVKKYWYLYVVLHVFVLYIYLYKIF